MQGSTGSLRCVGIPAALFIMIVALWGAHPAMAWNRTGHEIIAMLAYAQLTPEARAKVDAILKHHPRYRKDLLGSDASPPASGRAATQPSADDESPDDATQALDAFIAASAWPDEIRSADHPMHARFHHPKWHFIDIPFVIGDMPVPPGDRGSMSALSSTMPSEPDDAVAALNQSLAELSNPGTDPAARAVALCWVIHLVGDLHQPLHACDLVSVQFPTGDRGGNWFIILTNPERRNSQINLHWLWDSMLGDYESTMMMQYVADGIRHDENWSRPALREKLSHKTVAEWAAESHAVAVQSVYLNGRLSGTSSQVLKKEGSAAIPSLPAGYRSAAEQVAARQAALAGYRLADLLDQMLGK